MRRLVALVLAVSLASVSGSSLPRHIHVYGEHDHAQHHHGPAVHWHAHHAPEHGPQGARQTLSVEGCEPGVHAMALAFAGVEPPSPHTPPPADVQELVLGFPEPAWRAVVPHEVRVHGPPGLSLAPPRAPPPILPA